MRVFARSPKNEISVSFKHEGKKKVLKVEWDHQRSEGAVKAVLEKINQVKAAYRRGEPVSFDYEETLPR